MRRRAGLLLVLLGCCSVQAGHDDDAAGALPSRLGDAPDPQAPLATSSPTPGSAARSSGSDGDGSTRMSGSGKYPGAALADAMLLNASGHAQDHVVLSLHRRHGTAHRLSLRHDQSRWAALRMTGSVKWASFPFFCATVRLGRGFGMQQELGLVVDTGSADLLVAGPAQAGRGIAQRWYDPAKSITSMVLKDSDFNMRYEQGDAEGHLYRDFMTLGAAESNIDRDIKFDIGVVDKSQGLFAWEKFEGVLGLGRSQATSAGQTSFLDQLVHNNRVKNTFGLLLCDDDAESDDVEGGGVPQSQMVLGTGPDDLHTGEMRWTPLIGLDYYAVQLAAIKLNGVPLPGLGCSDLNSPGWSIVDSGTTSITLTSRVYAAFSSELKTYLPGHNRERVALFLRQRACLPLRDLSILPDFEFSFPDAHRQGQYFDVSVPPFLYMQHDSSDDGVPCYLLNVIEDCNPSTGAVLGMTFMQSVYVRFNRSSMVVGFGTSSCKLQQSLGNTVSASWRPDSPLPSCTPDRRIACEFDSEEDESVSSWQTLGFRMTFVMLSSLLTSILAMQLYSKLHRAIRRARVVAKENSPSRGTSNAVDDLLSWSRCDDEYFSDENPLFEVDEPSPLRLMPMAVRRDKTPTYRRPVSR